jgi:homoserine O-succinyltransferase/O-acetyltransferase
MPKKVQTEIQFARLIGATPLQIELTLIRMTEHMPRNTALDHLEAFYQTFQQARARKFDGLIITGAPVEHLQYEDVSYWDELRDLFEWTQTNVHHTMAVCWGGMAMLYHFHGVPKHMLPGKAFGCFNHVTVEPTSPYLRGFSDGFTVPVSRWTELRPEDLELNQDLQILVHSEDVGPCLIDDPGHRTLVMVNHLEYDSTTLREEYLRDLAKGGPIAVPLNYFPANDPSRTPVNRWRSHAHLLYGNWINQIYQTVPFDMDQIGS